MRSFLMSTLRWILVTSGRYFARRSLVGDRAVFDTEDFPWTREIEENWLLIRRELDAVLRYKDELPNFQEISVDQRGLSDDDRWKTYFFYAFGIKARRNCRRCPETARLLKRIPGMKTAFFSILGPRKHIAPHRGKCKGVIRYHLALLVPEARHLCRIRVGEETRHWEEGKSLLFDDTFTHEVFNETDQQRAVLFVDVVRPLPFPASLLNWVTLQLIAMSPMVLGSVHRFYAWEKRYEEAVRLQEQ
ncbi:MAG: aspartyl/asparaginyl beta-hydroxylase domain-containing protein [Pyrinomonadaceae bacterium]